MRLEAETEQLLKFEEDQRRADDLFDRLTA